MKKEKVYGVKKGKRTGVFDSWAECEKSIKGYKGAEYQSFVTRAEAEEYCRLQGKEEDKDKKMQDKQEETLKDNIEDNDTDKDTCKKCQKSVKTSGVWCESVKDGGTLNVLGNQKKK